MRRKKGEEVFVSDHVDGGRRYGHGTGGQDVRQQQIDHPDWVDSQTGAHALPQASRAILPDDRPNLPPKPILHRMTPHDSARSRSDPLRLERAHRRCIQRERARPRARARPSPHARRGEREALDVLCFSRGKTIAEH